MLLLALIVSFALGKCAWGADEEGKGHDIPMCFKRRSEWSSMKILITPTSTTSSIGRATNNAISCICPDGSPGTAKSSFESQPSAPPEPPPNSFGAQRFINFYADYNCQNFLAQEEVVPGMFSFDACDAVPTRRALSVFVWMYDKQYAFVWWGGTRQFSTDSCNFFCLSQGNENTPAYGANQGCVNSVNGQTANGWSVWTSNNAVEKEAGRARQEL